MRFVSGLLMAFALAVSVQDASAAANPPPPSCSDLPGWQLFGQRSGARRLHLLGTTNTIPSGTDTQVILVGSGDLANTTLRAFYTDNPADVRMVQISRQIAATEADVHPGDQQVSEFKDKLNFDPTGSHLLRIAVPNGARWTNLKKGLVVFACPANGTAIKFWADATPTLSPTVLPWMLSILLIVVIYMFCGTMVYLARAEQARQASTTSDDGKGDKTGGPHRFKNVDPWPWYFCLNPVAMTADMFDRGSLSKLQILFFSLLVICGLTLIMFRTGEISNISLTVVALLGISAGGSLLNQAVATTRDRLSTENWAWLVARKVLPINDPGKGVPRWTDLVMSDAELDLYKLQALTFSVVVGSGMVVGGFNLSTFSVPEQLLGVLGLSQVVFVGGRLTKPATMGDLDDLITELRKRLAALKRAAATKQDVNDKGEPAGDLKTVAITSLKEAAAAGAVPTAAQRYTETLDEVKVILESMAHRDIKPDQLDNPVLT